MFYSLKDIKSYNADVNIIVLMRSCGKTFAMKKEVINNYIENKTQFVWARQTREQLDVVIKTFLNDLQATEAIPDIDKYYIEDFKLFYQKDKDFEPDVVGYFVFLNGVKNAKGLSTPRATIYVQDEFIAEDNQYLKGEIDKFNSIISTVFRTKEKAKIYLLANAMSADNPYFNYFNVRIPKDQNIVKRVIDINGAKLVIATQFGFNNAEFKKQAERSLAGKINSLGEYGKSSLENEFILDDNNNIASLKDLKINVRFQINFFYDGLKMGFYICESNNFCFIGKPVDNQRTLVFNDLKEAAKENCVALSKKNSFIQILFSNYNNHLIIYEDLTYKNKILDLLNCAISL